MQFKSLFALATLATVSIATNPMPASQCTTKPIQCCNNVKSASDPATSILLALFGVVVQDPTVLIGLTCTPIEVIGIGGNSCSVEPLCCANNSFNGIIAVGCVPVDLSL